MQELPDPVKVFRIIGQGITSQVMECEIQMQHYAMKVFKPHIDWKSRQNEISILKSLQHPNIVSILKYDPCLSSDWLITELLQDKDLFDYIKIISQPFEEMISHYIFQSLVSAVSHMHSMGYVHRDLKLENILLHPVSNQVKLCDFGFAQLISSEGPRCVGTNGYMAPELFSTMNSCVRETIQGDELIKVDIFALGVILFIIIFGFPPFTSTNYRDTCPLWRAISTQRWPLFWKSIFRRGKPIPKELQQLLQGMMDPNSDFRYSMDKVVLNPWYLQDQVPEATYSNEIEFRKALI